MVAVLERSSLRAAVDETVAVDPDTLSDLETADALIELSGQIDRLEAQRARLAWSGHRRGIGSVDGSPSTPGSSRSERRSDAPRGPENLRFLLDFRTRVWYRDRTSSCAP